LEKASKAAGYKVQTRELSYFHDDYGLKTGDDEDDDDDSDDDDDESGESGSEESEEE
jgi:hypothetical protein